METIHWQFGTELFQILGSVPSAIWTDFSPLQIALLSICCHLDLDILETLLAYITV